MKTPSTSLSLHRAAVRYCAMLVLWVLSSSVQALDWPQEISGDGGTIVIYQPQPETVEGNVLTGRSAMSLVVQDGGDPIFGTFWFKARVSTDSDTDTAIIRDLEVVKVRWPDSKDAGEQRFTAVVEAAVPQAGFEISMSRLAASLATAETERKSLDELNNDPPKILFRESLAVLLLYDGEPRYEDIEGSSYEHVINTPFVVIRDKKSQHYLSSGQLWYQADSALGPWRTIAAPPADLAKLMPEPGADAAPAPAVAPEIVTATEPTELIVSDGKPSWDSLPGGEVLYVSNTESPWLRDLPTGNMYLLMSGRWFRSKTNAGPWIFVPANELPDSFASIPPASDIGGLRTSVAGTPEAEEAVLESQLPQTAAISRADAKFEVSYDGSPKFEQISGTSVEYAVNTASQVLRIDGTYYAVDNAVWFSAAAATGPWVIADQVPEQKIAEIPPSSPVYNTTHVHIYESTPQVVYVGYTPGYMWSFPYYGVPVYGTGWRYPPYRGPYYYPRPPTWGLNVGYNPWTGWNFGVSWSNGFFSFGVSTGGWGHHYNRCCGGGWYGGGYRGPTIINTGDINIGNTVNVGNRTNIGNKLERNNSLSRGAKSNNLYNRPENRTRKADQALVKKDFQQARESKGQSNNVFAERDGSLARLQDDKWQSRDKGTWKDNPELNKKVSPAARDKAVAARDSVTPAQREQAAKSVQQKNLKKPTATANRQHDLNRANHARQQGARVEQNRAKQRAPSRSSRPRRTR